MSRQEVLVVGVLTGLLFLGGLINLNGTFGPGKQPGAGQVTEIQGRGTNPEDSERAEGIPKAGEARGKAGHPAGTDQAVATAAVSETAGGGSGAEPGGEAWIFVHVAGAVQRPGVYRLPAGTRAVAALEAAGGAREDAVPESVNLAAPLMDGQQILIPTKAQAEGEPFPGVAGHKGSSVLVDVNRAGAAALQTLPGIGPVLASRIIQEREKRGPFKTVDDLTRVSGIGPASLELLRGLVTVR